MSERKELERVCELLGSFPAASEDKHHGATNLDLLKFIVNKLSTNGEEASSIIASDKIPDSLAFPERTRNNSDILNKPELWQELKDFNDHLKQDYTSRRQMLLNRLDCTVESFKWKAAAGKSAQSSGERNTPTNELIHETYEQARLRLKEEPDVSVSHLLATRETECDNLLNYVASSGNTDCKVVYKVKPQGPGDLMYLKRVVIPAVPDRGGRTDEIRAPQKETISQQRRSRGRGGRR